MTEGETNRAAVGRLMTILSGETPIQAGSELIAPDVVAYVDAWRFQGINVWANWIHYIRTRGRVAEPTLLVDEVITNSDATISACGRWQGMRHGRVQTSKAGCATYRLVHGRIVEIWSTRRNYTFLCGAHVEYHWGLAFELLRSQWRRPSGPRLDLLSPVQTQSVSRPTVRIASALVAPID